MNEAPNLKQKQLLKILVYATTKKLLKLLVNHNKSSTTVHIKYNKNVY